jgi:hypothetical protein
MKVNFYRYPSEVSTNTLTRHSNRSLTTVRYRLAVTLVTIAMSGAAQAAVGQAGCHAFDFEYGKWKMPNERLLERLVGSHQWEHFYTYDVGTPLPDCVGDIDIMRTDHWPHFVGVTIRTYDAKTGLWRIYWVDNRSSKGEIQPPVVGRFNGNVGLFYGKDTYNGIPVLVRFTWTLNPRGSKAVATWSQAFSTDGGRTWEVNWRNELIPDTR